MKLLWTAVKYFSRVQVSLLIDRKLVHAPHLSRQRPKGAPLIQHLAVQIILQNLECAMPVRHPQVPVFREKQMIDGRIGTERPHVQELAALVENLNSVILAVRNEHATRHRVYLNSVYGM